MIVLSALIPVNSKAFGSAAFGSVVLLIWPLSFFSAWQSKHVAKANTFGLHIAPSRFPSICNACNPILRWSLSGPWLWILDSCFSYSSEAMPWLTTCGFASQLQIENPAKSLLGYHGCHASTISLFGYWAQVVQISCDIEKNSSKTCKPRASFLG